MRHLFNYFFLGIGGLFRWSFFQLLNVAIEEKYVKDLEYYLNQKDKNVDENGFTTAQKNFLIGIFIFVALIFLIKKIES